MSHIVRRPYTQADKQHLIEWLATNHPEEKGRMGNAVWKALCDDQNASPWNDNHSWQSWREQYKQNDKYYINAINKELNKRKVSENTTFELSSGSEDDGERRPKARQPAAKNKQQRPYQRATRLILSENSDDGEEEQSHKSRQVTPPDPSNASKIRLLAKYYAEQSIAESIRSRADTIQDLGQRSCALYNGRSFILPTRRQLTSKSRPWNNSGTRTMFRSELSSDKLPRMRKRHRISPVKRSRIHGREGA